MSRVIRCDWSGCKQESLGDIEAHWWTLRTELMQLGSRTRGKFEHHFCCLDHISLWIAQNEKKW